MISSHWRPVDPDAGVKLIQADRTAVQTHARPEFLIVALFDTGVYRSAGW
jgi:hypothetical protein